MQPWNLFVLTLSSWFGTGYLPKVPGTWGTLGTLPLWWVMADLPVPIFVATLTGVAVLAILISHAAEKIYGDHDVGKIVIDEVAGFLVTVIAVPFQPGTAVAAFLLFRVLDMTKPWPIKWVDRRVGGGLGVVVDDLLAGAIACALLHGTRLVVGGWW